MERKFTFYSNEAEVLQSDNLTSLSPTQPLETLMNGGPFWLDINRPTSADLNYIAEVILLYIFF